MGRLHRAQNKNTFASRFEVYHDGRRANPVWTSFLEGRWLILR